MSSHCLNCGAAAPRRFCPECGQPTRDRRASLGTLFADFLTEFFSLDGRHLRTALALWRPGRLTELYLAGKRASHVPPVRVYFVASLLFFLLVSFSPPSADGVNLYVNDQLIERPEPVEGLTNLNLSTVDESSWLGRKISAYTRVDDEAMRAMSAQQVLDRFFRGLERTVPTALIFFVPVLALGLKLVYIRRKHLFVDHLVFALHFQSFLFALLVAARLLDLLLLEGFGSALAAYAFVFLVASPLYLFLAMLRVYGQPKWLTAVKTVVLGVLYLFLAQPVLVLTMILVLRGLAPTAG